MSFHRPLPANGLVVGARVKRTRVGRKTTYTLLVSVRYSDTQVVPKAAALVAEVIGKSERDGKSCYYINDGIYTFRGVRYGASTAGENRFMPPKSPERWWTGYESWAPAP